MDGSGRTSVAVDQRQRRRAGFHGLCFLYQRQRLHLPVEPHPRTGSMGAGSVLVASLPRYGELAKRS